MPESELRSRIERLSALPPAQREREAGATSVPEPVLLELIDEVRDLVMSDLDRAMAMGDVLRLVADRLELPIARARARSAWAHALNYANRFEEAIALLDEAAAIARANGDPLEEARADLAKIQSLARLGRFEEGIEAASRAEAAFEVAGEPALAVRAVTNHAILLRMLGRWSESVERFDRALELAAGDPTTTAAIQSNRAESLLELGRFEQAEGAFRESCELFENSGMDRVAAIVRGNLADLLGRQGRLSEAIGQFERARRFFERDRAVGDLARLEAELADVLAAVGLPDEAADLYEKSCGALEASGLAAERARALTGLGALLVNRAPERAGEVLEHADAAFEALDSPSGRARVRLLFARLALHEGRLDEARHLAGTLASGEEPPINTIVRATILSEMDVAGGNLDKAAAQIEAALSVAEQLSLPPIMADLHHRRARILNAQGRAPEAIEAYRRAMREVERIRGALQGDRFRSAFLGDRREIYQDAADAVLDLGDTESAREALGVTERARSRALLELIRGGVELGGHAASGAESRDEARLIERLGVERARLNYLYSRLDPAADAGGSRPMSEWLAELREVEAGVTSLESRLASSRAGRGVLATPLAGEEIADALPEGRAMLVYTRRRDSLGCFCVRGGEVRFVDLGLPLERLEELAGELGFQLRRAVTRGVGDDGRARRRIESAQRAGRALREAVFSPLEGEIGAQDRLTVVPYADLHLVPLGALHDGERYLVEDRAITLLPSASLYGVIEGAVAENGAGALVVGAADRFAPEIRAEVEAIAAVLPGSTLLAGEDATAEATLSHVGAASIVHIASHGIFPPGNPLAAALKMADRWVTVREIFGLRLRGTVVTLSGCETGRIEIDSGEEIYGFVRGFLAAGAGGIVSCLWAAHDRVARELMTRMYSEAPDEGSPASRVFRGLRAAQLEAIDQGIHPGLWSGFVAVGAA
ncbi:MAG: CHAT domain-containing tetratricopeptide repeat protein [Phycisphaerales bacterium]